MNALGHLCFQITSRFSKANLDAPPMYDIILGQRSLQKISAYKNELALHLAQPGAYLREALSKQSVGVKLLTTEQFIDCLLSTKKPLIFAESDIKCNGTDWNDKELSILGDISVGMKVKIYDNGIWQPEEESFAKHKPKLNGRLLFMPGPVLRGRSMADETPDYKEVTSENHIDQNLYNQLIDRRLTPLLYYANEKARIDNIQAFITIPGVGCGAFAGKFRGKMGTHLKRASCTILQKHAGILKNIACVYYDPFNECTNEEHMFKNLIYRVRPSEENPNKPQLCDPLDYEEEGDDFSKCKLFKVVAWDHVSFPGNDYFGGNRFTDDGVSAAATNSMQIITTVRGRYKKGYYCPPYGKVDWEQVVNDYGIRLRAKDNVKVLKYNGVLITLFDLENKITPIS